MNNFDIFTAFLNKPNCNIDVLGANINLIKKANAEPYEKIDWVDESQREFYVVENVKFEVELKVKKSFPIKKPEY